MELRLKKNRESACRSRQKKKQQLEIIEKEYNMLKTENIKIQKNVGFYDDK